jgi:hypothetical protein
MKIWCNDELYSLVQVFNPTKHDMYLACRRKIESQRYEDGTVPIEMILLHVNNETFMIDSPAARAVVRERKKIIGQGTLKKLHEKETNLWLKDVDRLEQTKKRMLKNGKL